jgi:hypothetical protein
MAERMSLSWSLSEAGCAAPSTAKTRHDVWPQRRFAAQSGILGSSPQTAEAAALAELEAAPACRPNADDTCALSVLR